MYIKVNKYLIMIFYCFTWIIRVYNIHNFLIIVYY